MSDTPTAKCRACNSLLPITSASYQQALDSSQTAVELDARLSCGHRARIVTSYRTYLRITSTA